MASANPADFLGLGLTHGRIAPGRQADLALFTQQAAILGTWLAGAWQPCS